MAHGRKNPKSRHHHHLLLHTVRKLFYLCRNMEAFNRNLKTKRRKEEHEKEV